jgi:Uma2 family endonuclease
MSTMVATQLHAAPKTEVTPEELLAMPDGGHYELIDGELKERNVSVLSNLVAAEINRIVGNHCRAHHSGWVFAAELGYRCFPWKPSKVRRADLSFIRRDRYSWQQLTHDGFMTIAPDLAVEVVFPNDLVGELDEKVEEYLRAGVQLVWVVRPAARAVQVFRGDRSASWLWAADELSGEDVLPGFHCKVGDLFPNPSEAEVQSPMISDSISPSPAESD